MVFSSFVFLLVFLPIVLILYYLCPAKLRNVILLFASLIFYAWGEPVYVLIMLFSTVFDYTNGRLIEKFKSQDRNGAAKGVLIVDMCGNLAILGFFKYTDFILGTINSLSGAGISLLKIALPIGISFYTFQTMSYTIDVYRGVVPAQKNILNFATYVVLFPQLIAGPIVQYKTIGKELESRKVTVDDFAQGAFRFTVGFAKKVILANSIYGVWTSISQSQNISMATAWLGAIAFTFNIYFDFSGYSDMAIGLGRMFGFHFLENFNYPYMANSVTDFWRRWHISLSSWFKEYVYIPLGGNRKGMGMQIRNILIVWALTGLWHGASFNFIAWGLYFCVFLIFEKAVGNKILEKLPSFLQIIYAMLVVYFGWFLFAWQEIPSHRLYLKAMFGRTEAGIIDNATLYLLSVNVMLFIILFIGSTELPKKCAMFIYGHTGNVLSQIIVSVYVVLYSSYAFLTHNPVLRQ